MVTTQLFQMEMTYMLRSALLERDLFEECDMLKKDAVKMKENFYQNKTLLDLENERLSSLESEHKESHCSVVKMKAKKNHKKEICQK